MSYILDENVKIKNRIKNAKDITRVFKNLQKKGYEISENPTEVFELTYTETIITKTGNNVFVKTIWRPHTEPAFSNGYKQEVLAICY